MWRDREICELLKESGYEMNPTDKYGSTPLLYGEC
jgi:hypothetical protein